MDVSIRFTIALVVYHKRLQRYLILRRNPRRYRGWGLVKGGVEPDETPEQACVRETFEEIGVRLLTDSLIDLKHQSAYFDNTKQLIVVVKWFFVFCVEDVVLKLEINEWVEYRWATYDEALYELVWQSQQAALRIAHANLFGSKKHSVEEHEN
jgi:dATP pyrophosphohydrolase